jgi:hypothetical protein
MEVELDQALAPITTLSKAIQCACLLRHSVAVAFSQTSVEWEEAAEIQM